MMVKLAVIAPKIGVHSETFIKRHMDNLSPDNTIVLAKTGKLSFEGSWKCSSRSYILDQYPPNPLQLLITHATVNKRLNVFTYNRFYAIKHILKKEKINVMLGEYLDYTHAYLEVADSLNIPIWGHAHGYDVSKNLLDERWCLKYKDYNDAAGVITVNRISKERLIERGIAEHKIHIVPCGVDVPLIFPRLGQTPDSTPVRCLAVGRMVRKKAPLLLLKSFHQACEKSPKLHLNFVGDGELMDEVIVFIDKYHLASNVTLHGSRSHEYVKRLMKDSDIFLQHSIVDPETGDEEGLPVAVLEAMAYGLPVISTRHAGIPDAVIEGQTGLLVNEGDTINMAKHIINLVEDASLRLNMGFEGWQRAGEYFSWQRERLQLIELLGLEG
jgi:colanic acid/amylovoran biosynthesis glycosyltransferase